MLTFTFYVYDDRYSVPTIAFVDARNEAHARELASAELMRSEHHLAVDAHLGEEPCFQLTRRAAHSATRTQGDEHSGRTNHP